MPPDPSVLRRIGNDIFQTLARLFPVTSASDEFHEFPQVVSTPPQWEQWDHFSKDAVSQIARQLLAWEDQLNHSQPRMGLADPEKSLNAMELTVRIDRTHLLNAMQNLREHLTLIRRWQRQPTFYLTIASIGMAESIASSDPAAQHKRASGLATFLDQAATNLTGVPHLFKTLGLEMLPDVRRYLERLATSIPELTTAMRALDRFEATLHHLPTLPRFQLPGEAFQRLIRFHLNTAMEVEMVADALDSEIATTRGLLNQILSRQFKGQSLAQAYEGIPLPPIPSGGLLGLYQHQVDHLAQFLVDAKIVSSAWVATCPVVVKPVPGFLAATRTASSYSIPPGHPPSGGTFYVINADDPSEATRGYQREYRILTAHETYPGHHLLDANRWRLENPIRQVIEHPIFYEGWACFAEELMFRTGYLKSVDDLLMLTRRRFWRALRGMVDLGMQKGTMELEEAAHTLNRAGLSLPQARKVVRMYTLNPGYQVCYTVGYQKFRRLFNKFGRRQLPRFVQAVLAQGEIHFDDMEKVLKSSLI